MRSSPLVRPVPGTGEYRFRPIYIGDVITCFTQSLTSDKAVNKTIDLVGPDELSLAQILSEIADCLDVRKPAVRILFPLMYMNAAILERLMSRPPVTTDQLRMLREGSTADPGPMLQAFALESAGFREGLKLFLCRH
jgi:NADH dehydrogenase